jgi:EAL domain-containing protein (putative c-di-GMP-specific phosphodiesterase class I)
MATVFRREPRPDPPEVTEAEAPIGRAAPSMEQIISRGLITVDFQPILHLDSRQVVGYEALTRGPAGTGLERPGALFAAAEDAGVAWELDTVARAAAFRAVLDANLHPSMSLFVNANPASVGMRVPPDLVHTVVEAFSRLRVYLDISERAMGINPAATLIGIEKARATGWGISLDNVGLTADSLALMPFARPDVIKLDVSLLHGEGHPRAPRVMGAVTAHAERSGAVTLAAGIESIGHLRTARALGATYGQGYMLGLPGPIGGRGRTGSLRGGPTHVIPLIDAPPPVDARDTPFRLASAAHPPVPATAVVVEALAADLEQRAALDQDPPVFLACLPQARLMSGGPLAFLQVIARSASYAAALCAEPPRHPPAGAHIVALAEDDPLRAEWTTVVIGPHFSALLTAREDDGGTRYRLTYDRVTVVRAARTLLQRITTE